MIPEVTEARHVGEYTIWLRFSDGMEGEVDLRGELSGPVFEPLRNKNEFCRFSVHPELHTIVWDNGADLAPEFLRDRLRVKA